MPVFLELIEQDPDITLAELQAALLAAHDVTASTRGIDALLRRHGCSYINQHFVSAGYGIEELGVPHRYREGTAIAFFLSLTIADLNRLRTNITGPGGSLLIYNVEKEIRAA
jgi:N-acyl-L-homoserine lactone synthetase